MLNAAGYSKAEVVGRNCRFLQGKDSDAAVVEDLRAATSHSAAQPCVVELINYRKDGSKFWNQVRRRCYIGLRAAACGGACQLPQRRHQALEPGAPPRLPLPMLRRAQAWVISQS